MAMTPNQLVEMGFGDFLIIIDGKSLEREQLTTSTFYFSGISSEVAVHFLDIHTEAQDDS